MLRDIERRDGFSNRVLAEHLEREHGLASRDRGLVTHLVYGTLRHRARLDRHIDEHATKPGKLKGELRTVLRVAALELLELGHPAHAAISEAVLLTRVLDRSGRLKGLVHAIAAAIDRTGAALDERLAAAEPVQALIHRWSIPPWLAARWLAELGPERALLRAQRLAQPPPIDVRIADRSLSQAQAAERLAADHRHATIETPDAFPRALRVRGAGDLFHGPMFTGGSLVVQGLASQVPATMLEVSAGQRVLDACAGMGGKTRQLAATLGEGTLVAADAETSRLDTLRDAMARHHAGTKLHVVAGDLTADLTELEALGPFDAVLLDAPCTGLGNLARHPEIRWTRGEVDVADRAKLQSALLTRCLARVARGGRLVYAVCSPEPEEGRDIVRAAVDAAPSQRVLVAERRLTPEDDDTEGFYVARIDVGV